MNPDNHHPHEVATEILAVGAVCAMLFLFSGELTSIPQALTAASGSAYCSARITGQDGKPHLVGEDVTMGYTKGADDLHVLSRKPDPALKAGECEMIELDKSGKVSKEYKTTPLTPGGGSGSKPAPSKPSAPVTSPTPAPTPTPKPTPSPALPAPKPAPSASEKKAMNFFTPMMNTIFSAFSIAQQVNTPSPSPAVITQTVQAPTVIHVPVQAPQTESAKALAKERWDLSEQGMDIRTSADAEYYIESSQDLPQQPTFVVQSTFSSSFSKSENTPEREVVIESASPISGTRELESDVVALQPTREDAQKLPANAPVEVFDDVRDSLAEVQTALSALEEDYTKGSCNEDCEKDLKERRQQSRVLQAIHQALQDSSADIMIKTASSSPIAIGSMRVQEKGAPRKIVGEYYFVLYDETGHPYQCNTHGYCTPAGEFIPVRAKRRAFSNENFSAGEQMPAPSVTDIMAILVKPQPRYRQSVAAPCSLLNSLWGSCKEW